MPCPSHFQNQCHVFLSQRSFTCLLALICLLCSSISAANDSWRDSAISLWQGEYSGDDSLGTSTMLLHGDPVFTAGKIDQGFSFDGTSYAEVINLPGFDGDTFTLHMWLRVELSPWFGIPIFKFYHQRGDTSVGVDTGGALCGRIESRHGGCTFGTGPGTFKDGELAHITIVKQGSNMSVFKNGVRVGRGTGSCCHAAASSLFIGGERIKDRGVDLMLDEIYYHNLALTDEQVAAAYQDYLINFPDEALLAELEEAYTLIDTLQAQIDQITNNNETLKNEISELENQNQIYVSQLLAWEEELDALENQVEQLEQQVESLEDQVDGLEHQVQDLQDQVAQLKLLVSDLDQQVRDLEAQIDALQSELSQLKQQLISSLSTLEEDFRASFHDPDFVIPGELPEDKLDNLVQAIIDLNKGRKWGLYRALKQNRQRPCLFVFRHRRDCLANGARVPWLFLLHDWRR